MDIVIHVILTFVPLIMNILPTIIRYEYLYLILIIMVAVYLFYIYSSLLPIMLFTLFSIMFVQLCALPLREFFHPIDPNRFNFPIHFQRIIELDIIPEADDGNYHDTQNVHDTGVQLHIREAFKLLEEKTALTISKEDTLKQITNYIFNEYNGKVQNKERAFQCIIAMKKTNGYITNIQKSELDVLQLVWNRICAAVNKNNATSLKENLIRSEERRV